MMIRRSYDFLKSVELLAPDNLLSFSSAVLLTDLRMRCMTLLWCDLIEIVERVLQGHASDAAEARLLRELLQLPFWQTHRAKPLPMAGERGGHAIEHTEAIEQASLLQKWDAYTPIPLRSQTGWASQRAESPSKMIPITGLRRCPPG